MTTNKKYYVVWAGRICGVYEDWKSCKDQIIQYDGAKYKAFESKLEANTAFKEGYEAYYKKNPPTKKAQPFQFLSSHDHRPELNSLAVDAAWNTVTKDMEYQGVHTGTRELWFKQGPFKGATNNIGEFLALVHGLALLKQMGSSIPIYSDSITAIAWVRHKKHKSVVLPTTENEIIFNLLSRAELWLINNSFNTPIIKWDTKRWGEIPADFGRK
ncbi:MAG: ribonuclease H family protein [Bacteroidales bacterium]